MTVSRPRPGLLLAAALAVLAPVLVLAPTGTAAEGTAAEGSARQAVVGSARGPDDYFPRDGNGGYQVDHYTITDRYRPGTDELVGTSVARARVGAQDLSAFHLDLRLTPDAVNVDGVPARFSKPTPYELRVTPRTPLAAGERFTVGVRYHGRPSRLGSGTPWPGFFNDGAEGIALGEPQIGPWWFAANETPRDKATYDVTIRVPRGQQAVGNGRLVSRTVGERWTAWRWRLDEPVSTYLAFFIAGRLTLERTTMDGRPVTYAVSRGLSSAQQSAAMQMLRRTPKVVRWLERRLGPYPYATTGGVVTAVPTGFALENASRPVYPYVGGVSPSSDRLVVHEQAHQWLGNAVTLRLWRDTWLHEGFASYAEWWWDEASGRRTVAQQLRGTYDAIDAGSGFWDVQVSDPGPAGIFDDAIYTRGAMMLAALRCRIGGPEMAALLRAWVDDNRGGTVTGEQFRAYAADRSGQDLTAFFEHWLDDTAKPADTAGNGLSGCA